MTNAQLPPLWCWTQLAEIGLINPRNSAPDGLQASFVPMAMISAEYGIANKHEVRTWGDIKSGYTHFAEGDVGLAKITPCFENGKSTLFSGLTGGIGAGTTELHIVRPILVSAEYIVIFLKSPHFIELGIPKMTGTAGQKRVPTEYFSFAPLPLPPLAEQHRIVAKVKELMKLCDRLEDAQEDRESRRDSLTAASLHQFDNGEVEGEDLREPARFFINHLPRLMARADQIQQVRQTLLNLAIRGRVVAQDPTDEPASELLKKIHNEKKRLTSEGKITPPGPLQSIRGEDTVGEPRPGWQVATLRDILLELKTGPFGSSLHQSDYQKFGVPVINPASIKDEHLVPIDGMAVGPATLERLSTFKLHVGDIVMARRGEMGRCAVVTENEAGWLCGTGSLILRLPSCVVPKFFVKLIGSPRVRNYLGGSAVGATMQNLNQSILLGLTLGLPPAGEQLRIVAKIEELMTLCNQLEEQLTSIQAESCSLLHAVFCEALTSAIEA